jgi:UDP-glucuronate decarboxylase
VHVLVTGGTGFFGRALLRYWHALGPERPRVTIVSSDPDRLRRDHPQLTDGPDWLALLAGDVTRLDSLPREGDFTHIIHAAIPRPEGRDPGGLALLRHGIESTDNLVRLADRLGVRRLLLTSSGAVYGPLPEGLEKVSEEHIGALDPVDPRNAYAIAKLASEQVCALALERFGVECVVGRCFAFSGEDLPLDYGFAIGNFVRDAVAGGPIVVNGDGSAIRSYMDQRDLARWLNVLVEQGQPGVAYNVGSDAPITIAQLAATVAEIAGCSDRVEIRGRSGSAVPSSRYVPSIDRARDDLGLDLTIGLSESIRHMLECAR